MLVAAVVLVVIVFSGDSCQRLFLVCFEFVDPVQLSSKSSELVEHCVENIFKLFGTLDTLNESLCNDVASLSKSPHTVLRFDFPLAIVVSQKKIESFLSKIKEMKKAKQMLEILFLMGWLAE